MRVISALDSVFAAQDDDYFGPYDTEDEWLGDYLKSRWPSGDRHMSGTVRVGGPELEDHPDYHEMRNAGWFPSRTRDAFVHPSGRVLTYGGMMRYGPDYPNGQKLNWFEQAIGEGPVYSRSHEKLTDALRAKGWEHSSDSPADSSAVHRDMRWLKEDRGR